MMKYKIVVPFLWVLLLHVVVEAQESGVTCGSSMDKNWIVLTCVNQNQFLEFNGNCINGVKEEAYSLRDCPFDQDSNQTYCHECGLNRVTCSSSLDPNAACADFADSDIPSNVEDCQEIGSVFLTQTYQCTSATDWAYEVVECSASMSIESVVLNESCASNRNNTPMCLECGPVGYCVPEGTTCNDLAAIQDPFVIVTVDTGFFEDKRIDTMWLLALESSACAIFFPWCSLFDCWSLRC